MRYGGTPRLETPRLVLRPLRIDDAEQMFVWTSDPQVTPHMSWPAHTDVEETRALLRTWVDAYQDPATLDWAVCLREPEPVLIGRMNVVRRVESVDLLEVGYVFGRTWWGQGYATETLRAVIDHLFAVVGANKVEATHDPRNVASGRVMEKAGMTTEGIRRASHRSSLGICDSQYHGMLRSEWEDMRGTQS